MLEILQFIFDNPFRYFGTAFLIILIGLTLNGMFNGKNK